MPGKGGDRGGQMVGAIAGAVAAFAMKKVIVFAWTKATGHRPPDKQEDGEVSMGEAIAWAVLVGAGVGAAKVLATRLATHQSNHQVSKPQA